MEIIGLIVAGVIIGLLGKFVAPSARDNTPLWLTVLCGIAGVLIGYYLAAASAITVIALALSPETRHTDLDTVTSARERRAAR